MATGIEDAARIAELESQIARLKEQSANALRELDVFAYAVSHDLRAPLRSLLGFSQALLESNETDASKSRHYLERIQQASRKLSDLIDALLSLSRVMRAEMHLRALDLTALFAEAVATVAAKYPQRTVRVVIAPNLSAYGDGRLLRTVLELLLDNAWKFTANQPTPSIEIGQTAAGEFYIVDNGAGFDMTYAEKLFKPFQRLHAEGQFPGVGIGLAIAQRIIARHGGRIRLEGKPDSGATVFFEVEPRQGTPTRSSS